MFLISKQAFFLPFSRDKPQTKDILLLAISHCWNPRESIGHGCNNRESYIIKAQNASYGDNAYG